MVYGDTAFMKELVDTFLEFAPIDTRELADYAKEQNWEEASKKAHKLKSSIRTIGVTSLFDNILSIELDAKNVTHTDTLIQRIDAFTHTLSLVISKLKGESFLQQ